MNKTKPFEISKKVVMEAYEQVKANKGTAGIDEQSIGKFEENLKNNLYKLWNRMSSGCYFPLPCQSCKNTEEKRREKNAWHTHGNR